MNIYTQKHTFNSDIHTVIGLYQQLRNKHRKPVLLESNDYHSRAESKSIIGINPLVEMSINENNLELISQGKSILKKAVQAKNMTSEISESLAQYTFLQENDLNGFISYFSFEFSHYSENKTPEQSSELGLPDALLILYETYIVVDHFHDTGTILFNSFDGKLKEVSYFESLLTKTPSTPLSFQLVNEEVSLTSEEEFLKNIEIAKTHLFRGDVFQLVLSRRFKQHFFGDDFQMYRELRRLNPSPYLFYLDFEDFRLIGSSPESQIQLKNKQASIHPIAGTVKKSGDQKNDEIQISNLISDEKENAEHTMLVDLARNDLSKFCSQVKIEKYKEVQHFSHVFHLVSKIIGQTEAPKLDLFSGTFPAGTLSGTPKPKALELIAQYENHRRDFYGGAIGIIGANQSMNLAIIIRSSLSKNNTLHYQAGAGLVLDSVPENELKEVDNKLGAVRKAIGIAAENSTQLHNKLHLISI
jgi:anthranilate synthase component 1